MGSKEVKSAMRRRHKRSTFKLKGIPQQVKLTSVLLIGIAAGYFISEEFREPQIVQAPNAIQIQTCFTPQHKCQPLILREINHAQKSIYMMGYSFTAEPVDRTLIAAHQRGVEVKVILDRSQLKNRSQSHLLEAAGIPIFIDETVAIAHNKVLIIDNQKLVVGSYNFTNAAEYKNAENLMIIESPEIVARYLDNWQNRVTVSTPKQLLTYHD
jgi:phospholipase D